MRIRKTYNGVVPNGKILNSYSTSQSDGYSCEYINGLETYSTTEQRIGTWIDGKPLYRKVVNVTMPNNEIKQTAHNIQNIDVITNIKGITVSRDGIVFIPINTANTGDNSYALQTWADKIYISVRSGVDYTMQTGFVILEYTKTTD